MQPRPSNTLLVINGPVGVGKSTSAKRAVESMRSSGLSAAAIDLDEVYRMLSQKQGFDEPATWRNTRRAAATLADFIFDNVASVVAIEGGFYTPADLDELGSVSGPKRRFVHITLHASYEVVYRRVLHDPDPRRVASKIPSVLAQLYSDYEAAIPYLRDCGPLIDVTHSTATEVGAAIAAHVANRLSAC